MMQRVVKCGAAHRRAQIPASSANRGEVFCGHAELLCEERYETRIRLMGREGPHHIPRNAAAVLHFIDYFFHAAYRGAGKRIAIELHFKFATAGIADSDCFGVLRCATEEELAQAIR